MLTWCASLSVCLPRMVTVTCGPLASVGTDSRPSLGIKQPPVSRHHRAEIKRWAEAERLQVVCTELVGIVANFGRMMTASEAA